jgi:hypothetical protein
MVFDASSRVFIWPHLRGHVQTGASFWQRAYAAAIGPSGTIDVPVLRSGDRELGPVQSATLGLGLRWDLVPRTSPTELSLLWLGDATFTRYPDALFITSRSALFSALELEVVVK